MHTSHLFLINYKVINFNSYNHLLNKKLSMSAKFEDGKIVFVSPKEASIQKAWAIDEGYFIFFNIVRAVMYALTFIPSALGVVPILSTKSFIFWFLVIDAVYKFINLDKKPASEAYIWT